MKQLRIVILWILSIITVAIFCYKIGSLNDQVEVQVFQLREHLSMFDKVSNSNNGSLVEGIKWSMLSDVETHQLLEKNYLFHLIPSRHYLEDPRYLEMLNRAKTLCHNIHLLQIQEINGTKKLVPINSDSVLDSMKSK